MIDAKRIEEMKRLSADATEGPWFGDGGILRTIYGHNEVCDYSCGVNYENNAQFIAESRQFVPDIIAAYEEQVRRVEAHTTTIVGLCGMVERRDEEIAKLRKALADIQSDCESAKERYIEESDVDGILGIAREALK